MSDERVTIRELARVSGVSVGTVSRALNGYTDVRPETRERIMRLAQELDYTPAAAARSLVTQRSHVIGVFLETGEGHPDIQHPFFHEVLGGLKQRVGAGGFDLLLFASERPGNGYGPHSYLKRARHHAVDGVALMGDHRRRPGGPPPGPRGPAVRRHRHGRRRPPGRDRDVGQCRRSGPGRGAPAQLGHRRIATITGMLESRPGSDRLRGYRAAVQAAGLGYRDEYVAYGDFYVESGRACAARLLSLARAADGDLRRGGHDGHRRRARRRRGWGCASRRTSPSSASTTSSSPPT